MYRIFLVEDDEGIAEGIKKSLSMWGMEVQCAGNFERVADEIDAFNPHLVLMDISLPYMDGYYWCRELRKKSRVPVIFISSASENMNVIMAVNMGGDDFIAKPFDLSVLSAKVQAMLRRTYDFGNSAPVLECAGAVLNTGDNTLVFDGRKIELSKNEYRILLTLIGNKGRIVSREKMMEALWETDSFVDENTLTVNVGRLRKKLEGCGLAGFISTKHGVGYMVGE